MRRTLLFVLVSVLVTVGLLLHTLSTLISLLVQDTLPNAVYRADLPGTDRTSSKSRPSLIPQIIHQTYINDSIPDRWRLAQKSCIDLHPDYEYIMWTDVKARNFIEREYSWFLPTFDGYQHPIQRADTLRYFVLAYYGGTYLDLDQGCKQRLDPLLSYPAWLRRTLPTGISNDLMGAMPQHPFFLHVIESLEGANRKWVLPYITIMASTGPLFLSVMWKEWMDEHANLEQENWLGRVHVLMPELTETSPERFFEAYGGSSWHGRDAELMLWMGRGKNWVLVTACGLFLGAMLGFGIWRCCRGLRLVWNSVRQDRGKRIDEVSTRKVIKSYRLPSWMGLRRLDEERGGRKADYELAEQHDA